MFFATIRRTTTFGAAKSRCLSRWSVIECAPVNRYASARSTRADRHCVLTSVQGGASSGVSPHSCVHLRYTVTLIRRNLLTSPSGSWHRSVTESVALPPAMRECLCLTLNSPTNFLPGNRPPALPGLRLPYGDSANCIRKARIRVQNPSVLEMSADPRSTSSCRSDRSLRLTLA